MAFNLTAQLNIALNSASLKNASNQLNAALNSNTQVKLGIDRNGASGISQVKSQISEATDAMENFGRQAGFAAKRFAAFAVTAGSIIAFTNTMKEAISTAVDFDKEMVRLRQVSSDTVQDVGAVGDQVTNLSKNLGVSSKDLIGVAVVLKQANLTLSETKDALEAMAQAALAPNFDNLKDTSEGAIAIIKQFKIEAKDLGSALGSVNAVAGEFAVEASDIIEAIRKTGGAFKAAGGNLNELIALFTSVRQTTRESAESIGTGLRTIFTRIQRNDTANALKEIGINLRYTADEARALGDAGLEQQFVGPYEAIKRLSAGLSELRSTDPRFSAIVEQLGGYRQISKVIPLIQEFATAQKALGVAQAGSVSLAVNAGQAQDALAVKLQKLKESFFEVGRSIVNSPGFRSLADTFISASTSVLSLINSLKGLLPLFTALAAVKIGQSIGSFASGFAKGAISDSSSARKTTTTKKADGGFLRMQKGGIVPGSGSGDKVPALLEPGEMVIPRNQIRKNKYSDGGSISVSKMPSLTIQRKLNDPDVKEEQYKSGSLINKKDLFKYKISTVYIDGGKKSLKGDFKQQGNYFEKVAAKKLDAKRIAIKGENGSNSAIDLEKNKFPYEVKNVSTPVNDAQIVDKLARYRLQKFGDDAFKNTLKTGETIDIGEIGLVYNSAKINKNKEAFKSTNGINIEDENARKKIVGKKSNGNVVYKEQSKIPKPKSKFQGGSIIRMKKGGIVPGTGSGDIVPALLEPGELVIPKHQVGRRKFAEGKDVKKLSSDDKSALLGITLGLVGGIAPLVAGAIGFQGSESTIANLGISAAVTLGSLASGIGVGRLGYLAGKSIFSSPKEKASDKRNKEIEKNNEEFLKRKNISEEYKRRDISSRRSSLFKAVDIVGGAGEGYFSAEELKSKKLLNYDAKDTSGFRVRFQYGEMRRRKKFEDKYLGIKKAKGFFGAARDTLSKLNPLNLLKSNLKKDQETGQLISETEEFQKFKNDKQRKRGDSLIVKYDLESEIRKNFEMNRQRNRGDDLENKETPTAKPVVSEPKPTPTPTAKPVVSEPKPTPTPTAKPTPIPAKKSPKTIEEFTNALNPKQLADFKQKIKDAKQILVNSRTSGSMKLKSVGFNFLGTKFNVAANKDLADKGTVKPKDVKPTYDLKGVKSLDELLSKLPPKHSEELRAKIGRAQDTFLQTKNIKDLKFAYDFGDKRGPLNIQLEKDVIKFGTIATFPWKPKTRKEKRTEELRIATERNARKKAEAANTRRLSADKAAAKAETTSSLNELISSIESENKEASIYQIARPSKVFEGSDQYKKLQEKLALAREERKKLENPKNDDKNSNQSKPEKLIGINESYNSGYRPQQIKAPIGTSPQAIRLQQQFEEREFEQSNIYGIAKNQGAPKAKRKKKTEGEKYNISRRQSAPAQEKSLFDESQLSNIGTYQTQEQKFKDDADKIRKFRDAAAESRVKNDLRLNERQSDRVKQRAIANENLADNLRELRSKAVASKAKPKAQAQAQETIPVLNSTPTPTPTPTPTVKPVVSAPVNTQIPEDNYNPYDRPAKKPRKPRATKKTSSTTSFYAPQEKEYQQLLAGINAKKGKRFASGGLVPGVGNSDTVPMDLPEGSFVIRKSSVNKIGADNLAKAAKFASGGTVPALVTPGEYVYGPEEASKIGSAKLHNMNQFAKFARGGAVKLRKGGTPISEDNTFDPADPTKMARLAKQLVDQQMQNNPDLTRSQARTQARSSYNDIKTKGQALVDTSAEANRLKQQLDKSTKALQDQEKKVEDAGKAIEGLSKAQKKQEAFIRANPGDPNAQKKLDRINNQLADKRKEERSEKSKLVPLKKDVATDQAQYKIAEDARSKAKVELDQYKINNSGEVTKNNKVVGEQSSRGPGSISDIVKQKTAQFEETFGRKATKEDKRNLKQEALGEYRSSVEKQVRADAEKRGKPVSELQVQSVVDNYVNQANKGQRKLMTNAKGEITGDVGLGARLAGGGYSKTGDLTTAGKLKDFGSRALFGSKRTDFEAGTEGERQFKQDRAAGFANRLTTVAVGANLLGEKIKNRAGTGEGIVSKGEGDTVNVNEEKASSFKSSQAFGQSISSASTYAATAAQSLAQFGPVVQLVGAGLGGLVGAINGYNNGIEEAEAKIRDAKIAQALNNLQSIFEKVSNGLLEVNDSTLRKISENQKVISEESATKAYKESGGNATAIETTLSRLSFGLLGKSLNQEKFSESFKRSKKENESSQLVPITNLLNKLSQETGKDAALKIKSSGGDLSTTNFEGIKGGLLEKIRSSGGGVGKEQIAQIASAQNITIPEAEKQFIKTLQESFQAEKIKTITTQSIKENSKAISSMESLSNAVNAAAAAADSFSSKLDTNSSLFEGSIGSTKLTSFSEQYGGTTPDFSAFNAAIIQSAGVLGTYGEQFKDQGNAVNVATQILPNILANSVENPISGNDISTQISDALKEGLKQRGITGASADQVASSVSGKVSSEEFTKLLAEAGGDVSKASKKLISDISGPLISAFNEIDSKLTDAGNKYISGLEELAKRQKAIGDQIGRLSDLRSKSRSFMASEIQRLPGVQQGVAETINLQGARQDFSQQQQRLTGFGASSAENPAAIASRLAKTQERIREQEQKVRTTNKSSNGGEDFRNAALELTKLKSQASNLNDALKNLTDQSKKLEAAQAKLAQVRQGIDEKRSLGRKLLTQSPEEQQKMLQGQALFNRVKAQGGSVAGLDTEQNSILFDFLDNFGSAGKKIADQILDANGYGASKDDMAEEKQLVAEQARIFAQQEEAQKQIIQNQQSLQQDYFSNLDSRNEKFYSELQKFTQEIQKNQLVSEKLGKQQEVSKIQNVQKEGKFLGNAGFNTKEDFEKLSTYKGQVLDLVKNKQEVTRTDELASKAFGAKNVEIASDRFGNNKELTGSGSEKLYNQLVAFGYKSDEALKIRDLSQQKLDEGYGTDDYVKEARKQFHTEKYSELKKSRDNSQETINKSGISDKLNQLVNSLAKNEISFEQFDRATSSIKELQLTAGQGLTTAADAASERIKALNAQIDQLGGIQVQPPAPAQPPVQAGGFAIGGSVFKPKGSDTVPAMLTPGEFVVNKNATQQNLPLLQSINSGKTSYLANGGMVGYYQNAGPVTQNNNQTPYMQDFLQSDEYKNAIKPKGLLTTSFSDELKDKAIILNENKRKENFNSSNSNDRLVERKIKKDQINRLYKEFYTTKTNDYIDKNKKLNLNETYSVGTLGNTQTFSFLDYVNSLALEDEKSKINGLINFDYIYSNMRRNASGSEQPMQILLESFDKNFKNTTLAEKQKNVTESSKNYVDFALNIKQKGQIDYTQDVANARKEFDKRKAEEKQKAIDEQQRLKKEEQDKNKKEISEKLDTSNIVGLNRQGAIAKTKDIQKEKEKISKGKYIDEYIKSGLINEVSAQNADKFIKNKGAKEDNYFLRRKGSAEAIAKIYLQREAQAQTIVGKMKLLQDNNPKDLDQIDPKIAFGQGQNELKNLINGNVTSISKDLLPKISDGQKKIVSSFITMNSFEGAVNSNGKDLLPLIDTYGEAIKKDPQVLVDKLIKQKNNRKDISGDPQFITAQAQGIFEALMFLDREGKANNLFANRNQIKNGKNLLSVLEGRSERNIKSFTKFGKLKNPINDQGIASVDFGKKDNTEVDFSTTDFRTAIPLQNIEEIKKSPNSKNGLDNKLLANLGATPSISNYGYLNFPTAKENVVQGLIRDGGLFKINSFPKQDEEGKTIFEREAKIALLENKNTYQTLTEISKQIKGTANVDAENIPKNAEGEPNQNINTFDPNGDPAQQIKQIKKEKEDAKKIEAKEAKTTRRDVKNLNKIENPKFNVGRRVPTRDEFQNDTVDLFKNFVEFKNAIYRQKSKQILAEDEKNKIINTDQTLGEKEANYGNNKLSSLFTYFTREPNSNKLSTRTEKIDAVFPVKEYKDKLDIYSEFLAKISNFYKFGEQTEGSPEYVKSIADLKNYAEVNNKSLFSSVQNVKRMEDFYDLLIKQNNELLEPPKAAEPVGFDPKKFATENSQIPLTDKPEDISSLVKDYTNTELGVQERPRLEFPRPRNYYAEANAAEEASKTPEQRLKEQEKIKADALAKQEQERLNKFSTVGSTEGDMVPDYSQTGLRTKGNQEQEQEYSIVNDYLNSPTYKAIKIIQDKIDSIKLKQNLDIVKDSTIYEDNGELSDIIYLRALQDDLDKVKEADSATETYKKYTEIFRNKIGQKFLNPTQQFIGGGAQFTSKPETIKPQKELKEGFNPVESSSIGSKESSINLENMINPKRNKNYKGDLEKDIVNASINLFTRKQFLMDGDTSKLKDALEKEKLRYFKERENFSNSQENRDYIKSQEDLPGGGLQNPKIGGMKLEYEEKNEEILNTDEEYKKLKLKLNELYQYRSRGGLINYLSDGGVPSHRANPNPSFFKPKGTDTVPAMLTPGEFVINAAATAKHGDLLHAINNGQNVDYSSAGGLISYLAYGGSATGMSKQLDKYGFDKKYIDKGDDPQKTYEQNLAAYDAMRNQQSEWAAKIFETINLGYKFFNGPDANKKEGVKKVGDIAAAEGPKELGYDTKKKTKPIQLAKFENQQKEEKKEKKISVMPLSPPENTTQGGGGGGGGGNSIQPTKPEQPSTSPGEIEEEKIRKQAKDNLFAKKKYITDKELKNEIKKLKEDNRIVDEGMEMVRALESLSKGGEARSNSDTIPAMLTPGEFVVNARSSSKNASLLHAINSGKDVEGFSQGGSVGYYAGGKTSGGRPSDRFNTAANNFNMAVSNFDRAISKINIPNSDSNKTSQYINIAKSSFDELSKILKTEIKISSEPIDKFYNAVTQFGTNSTNFNSSFSSSLEKFKKYADELSATINRIPTTLNLQIIGNLNASLNINFDTASVYAAVTNATESLKGWITKEIDRQITDEMF